MITLAQAIRPGTEEGNRLSDAFPAVAGTGSHRVRGALHLTVAAPGNYKSVYALEEALRMAVPCLYVSMDTDPSTMSTRALQSLCAATEDTVRAGLRSGATWVREAVARATNIRFSFPNNPSIDGIIDRVFAFAEAEGKFPEWIVIDNLMDIHTDEEELIGIARSMEQLQHLGRLSGAGVHALHHAMGQYENGETVIPMSGVRGKVSKKPSVIHTLCRSDDGNGIRLSVVKNRFGPADPTGARVYALLPVDGETMSIG